MPHSATSRSPAAGLDDYRWLTSRAAAPLLEMVASSSRTLAAEVAHLRRELSPARTHLLMEQVALRRRARTKFAAADRMFFTPRGLEQTTDETVAAYKARRFAGLADVFDLCSGIGGDLLALARWTNATGFDRDPTMVIVAEANARLLADETGAERACHRAAACVCDVAGVDVGQCVAWHVDPDRRPSGRRTTRVDLHEPGVEVIERLLVQNPSAAIKLAPAAQLPESWYARAELEWISRGRECRQLVAWFGQLASNAGRRRATVLDATLTPRTLVGFPSEGPPAVDRVGKYVFEPDAAVLAAKLGPTLAAEHGLAPITAGIAYWTGELRVDEAALSCFEVREVLAFDLKRLKALLRARDIGQLEIKKRGVDHEPEKLRRQSDLAGDASATLLVTRIAGRVTAIVARRV